MNMNEIEEQLKHALRRCQPPEGFAERVMARLDQEPSFAARAISLWQWPSLRWAAVAAAVAVAATGIGYQIHERQEEAEAKAANQQVILALRIKGNKLRGVKQRLKAVETGTQKVENTL